MSYPSVGETIGQAPTRRSAPLGDAAEIDLVDRLLLLKFGIDIGETSVGKYASRKLLLQKTGASSSGIIVSVDFFMAPCIRFQVLYVFRGLGSRPKASRSFQRQRPSRP